MINDRQIEPYRNEFGVTKNAVYLDHAGVSPVPLRVKSVVSDFLTLASEKAILDYDSWMGRVEEVRAKAANLVGSDSDEIAFIKNTSHGISLVSGGLDWKEGDNIIITDKEFPSNVYPWLDLQDKGVEVRTAPFVDGRIAIADIEALMDSNTRLLSISSVQSVNGFRIDLSKLGDLCKSKGVLLFVDAIQSLGIVPMDVRKYGIDFLSADGHKWMMAPEGTGIFYCRRELCSSIKPGLIGWMSVEDTDFEKIDYNLKTNAGRFEEGTYNVMGIYALGSSLEMINDIGLQNIYERVLSLGEFIISQAQSRGFEVKSPLSSQERGGIVSFSGGFDPVLVREKLLKKSIVVNQRGGAIRLAPHFYNTADDILKFFSAFDHLVEQS